MPLPFLDALPLMLLSAIAGLGAGWGLAMWTVQRQSARAPVPARAPASAPTEATVVRARTGTTGTRLATDAAPQQPAPMAAEPTPLPPPAADLLVVDDSAVARTKLRRLFEAAGYRVHLANDGVEALALLDKGDYRLLVTDLEMPNMDGITLINNCKARPQTARMPMLAITGHESLRTKFNECRDVAGIHRKPWVDDILLSHVATLVGARTRGRTSPAAGQPA